MSRIRVLLVDDHPVFLEGLYTILSLRDPEIEVVGTASNGEEALARAGELSPDVVLLDIKMPIVDGVEVARKLKQTQPDVAIVMLTTFDDRPLIRAALEAGATGYLLKDADAGQIIEAIKHATGANVVISGDLALRLSSAGEGSGGTGGGSPASPSAAEGPAGGDASLVGELSERQIDILRLIARGRTNSEISSELFLSEKTVRNYISQIYEILNTHTRTKAAIWALQNLPDPPGGAAS